jgi:hypothetical protein
MSFLIHVTDVNVSRYNFKQLPFIVQSQIEVITNCNSDDIESQRIFDVDNSLERYCVNYSQSYTDVEIRRGFSYDINHKRSYLNYYTFQLMKFQQMEKGKVVEVSQWQFEDKHYPATNKKIILNRKNIEFVLNTPRDEFVYYLINKDSSYTRLIKLRKEYINGFSLNTSSILDLVIPVTDVANIILGYLDIEKEDVKADKKKPFRHPLPWELEEQRQLKANNAYQSNDKVMEKEILPIVLDVQLLNKDNIVKIKKRKSSNKHRSQHQKSRIILKKIRNQQSFLKDRKKKLKTDSKYKTKEVQENEYDTVDCGKYGDYYSYYSYD